MPISAYSLGLTQGTPADTGHGDPFAGAHERIAAPFQVRAQKSAALRANIRALPGFCLRVSLSFG
jgi:hypothetical protein